MSYLKFDKVTMLNLEETLYKEILRTNRAGAYHCTTIVDCNTRKYHGLLVIPIPELDDDNHVLLSSLDETVIQHDVPFNLGLHKYQADNFSPRGHKYIREFDCDTVPRTVYRVGGVILSKEKLFISHENRILIRYTLLDAHSPTKLRFSPYLAFRSVRMSCCENNNVNKEYHMVENGIRTKMYEGYPDLYMQFSKKCDYHFNPDWYRGLEYIKEQERGYNYKEDLYVPGYFELAIKKGESVVFSAGTSEISTKNLATLFEQECLLRPKRDSFFNCLKNSAQQFYYKVGENEMYILAGYPWFKCRARDMFISLPGTTLSIEDRNSFEQIMNTAIPAMYNFMQNKPLERKIYEIDHPDVLLWAVWSLQQYSKEVGVDECVSKYGDLLTDIMDYIRANKHPNLNLHENGLLSINGKDRAITWMNSTVNGRPVVSRTGYVVEINCLWYNALKFISALKKDSDTEYAEILEDLAINTQKSFVNTFLNGYGYLYDYVDGDYVDWSVRPNMIFAVSLDYSPLDRMQQKIVLDVVTRELLTPKGIRSLSPKSTGYNPYYVGTQIQRDYAYHQGTAWPWLCGAYLEAYLRIYKMSGITFVERTLIGFEEEMKSHCIGSIPEVFDGNPPFKGRGAVSFAMSVAGILRVLKLLKKIKNN
ncbi:MAG: amylo-alpha-1,6-glucosidase [Bacteroidales bacterium]|jgi:predicted glycogen debranching enzyme|nr:amylo-alpha-1,6-glucosidase [Bacteroidales bacterium]